MSDGRGETVGTVGSVADAQPASGAPAARDVFISYASGDLALAREIRSHLENGGYSCWMSPDDVAGAKSWAEQIVEAIAECKVMLVLVSSVSNASDHVSKEVDLAIEHGKAVLPVRIEDVVPAGALRYLLALAQWIDAFPGPIAPHADEVKRRVAAIVAPSEGRPAAIDEDGVEPEPGPVADMVPPPAAPRPVRRSRLPWVAAAAVVVAIAGIVALVAVRSGTPYEYGDDTRLDWLWDRCDSGDMASCDALTGESNQGTDYRFFGETCGERVVGGGNCIEQVADETGPFTYGDHPDLDHLWDGCNAEDFAACAELHRLAPPETEYEFFGGSCGGRTEFPQGCEPLSAGYAELDAFREGCAVGEMEACWNLYLMSPIGSEYEEFGRTCGARTDGTLPCVFTRGDSPYLDDLWDACAEGAMEACDVLYLESPEGSEYEDFGWSCGWTWEGGGECAGS